MTIAWSAAMTTGAASLDEEHRRLVARLNALLEAVAEGRDVRAVERALRDAGDAALRHFSRDEDCAMRGECPALRVNGEARADFLGILRAFREDYERSAASPATSTALEQALSEWATRYIPGPGAALLPCVAAEA